MLFKYNPKLLKKAVSIFLSILMVASAMLGAGFPGLTANAGTITKEVSISFSSGEVVVDGFNDSYWWGLKYEDNLDTQNGVTGLKMQNDALELTVTDPDFLTGDPVSGTIVVNYYEFGDYNPENNDMYVRCSTVSNPYYGDSFGRIPPGTTGYQTVTYTADDLLFDHNIFSDNHAGKDFVFYQRGRQILILDVTITYTVEDTGGTPTPTPTPTTAPASSPTPTPSTEPEKVVVNSAAYPYRNTSGGTAGPWSAFDSTTQSIRYFMCNSGTGWWSDGWQWMYNDTANMNEYMDFTFTGTSIAVDFLSSVETGIAKIYIDGIEEDTIDTYDTVPTTDNRIVTFERNNLSAEEHTIRVQVAGKNAAITGWAGVLIKAFEYTPCEAPPGPRLITVNSSNTPYINNEGGTSGAWYNKKTGMFPFFGFDSGRSWWNDSWSWMYNNANNANENMDFFFKGSYIALYLASFDHGGIARIFLDGVDQGTVDTYNSSVTSNSNFIKVFEKDNLESGNHYLRVQVVGKNPAVTDWSVIGIGGFECYELGSSVPITEKGITILSLPDRLSYNLGGVLDLSGLEVIYSDGTNEPVPIEVTPDMVSGFDSQTPGMKSITITYNGYTAAFTVNILGKLILVSSPAYYSDINENEITIEFNASGLSNARAESLHAPDSVNSNPYGYMKTIADNIVLDEQGNGSFTFNASDFPFGPISIHIMAWKDGIGADDCYLQLFNNVGAQWDGGPGNTADGIPAAIEGMGMATVFFDDFTEMPSITYTGNGDAKYAAAKPDPDGWPEYSDAKFAPPGYSYGDIVNNYNPFAIKDDQYMQIETKYWGAVIEPNWGQKFTTGFLSSMGQDGSGFITRPGAAQYFETRLFLPPNPGLWPAFWTLTPDDPAGRDGHDELDVLEAYMGGITDTITYNHHTWGYESIHDGGSAKTDSFGNGINLTEGWHTYGMLITEDTTYYYFDDQYIPGSAHPTLNRSWTVGSYFMVNNAYRQYDADKYPGGFQRYGNTSKMYVDWVRVFQVEDTGFKPLLSKIQVKPGETVKLDILRSDDVKGLSGTYGIEIPEDWTVVSGGSFGAGNSKDTIVINVPAGFSVITGTISITPVSGGISYDTMQISFTTLGLFKAESYLTYDSSTGEYDLNVKLFNLSANSMSNVEFTARGPGGWTQSDTISSINAGGTGIVTYQTGALDIYELTNYFVDIKISEDYTITIDRLASGLIAPRAETPITIDGAGHPDEWAGSMTLELNSQEQVGKDGVWNGMDDLSATVKTKWDENYLYLNVEVKDNVHYMTEDNIADAWRGDSLQISFDPARSSGIVVSGKHLSYVAALESNAAAYGIAVDRCDYPELGQSWNQLLTRSRSSITRDEASKTTTYMLAFAWADIMPQAYKDTTDIGMSLLVNDNDGSGRKCWIKYMDGIATGKDPAKFGDLILAETGPDIPVPTPAPTPEPTSTPTPVPSSRTISLSMVGNGISSPASTIDINVKEGSDITVTFNPKKGYKVDKVEVDGTDVTVSDNSCTLTNVTGNHDMVVTFKEIKTFAINASSGKDGKISSKGSVNVNEGEDITFTFVPNEGYSPNYVKIDGKKVEVDGNSYTFTNVTKNHTIEVAFKKNKHSK